MSFRIPSNLVSILLLSAICAAVGCKDNAETAPSDTPPSQTETAAPPAETEPPPVAVEPLQEPPVGTALSNHLHEAAELMAKPDPRGAYRLLQQLDPADFETALVASEQLTGVEPKLVDRLRGMLIGLWVNSDPVAMLDYASQLPEPAAREELTARALKIWSSTSPESAYRWCLDAHDAGTIPGENDMLGPMIQAWAKVDSEAALEAFWELPSTGRKRVRQAIVSLVNDGSVRDRYLTSLANMPEGDYRAGLIAETVSRWASSGRQPELAAAWVGKLDTPHRGQIEGALADAWARGEAVGVSDASAGNPQAAANWLLYQPPNDSREGNLRSVLTQWVAIDPDAATSWFDSVSRAQLQVGDSGYEALRDSVNAGEAP